MSHKKNEGLKTEYDDFDHALSHRFAEALTAPVNEKCQNVGPGVLLKGSG